MTNKLCSKCKENKPLLSFCKNKSKKVCGLHCWANLQLLDPMINVIKSNRYWPDMP
jgi:hypothetical protein